MSEKKSLTSEDNSPLTVADASSSLLIAAATGDKSPVAVLNSSSTAANLRSRLFGRFDFNVRRFNDNGRN